MKHYLKRGNITFVPNVTLIKTEPSEIYYRYSFGDGSPEKGSSAENITHHYSVAMNYSYWVDAIAVVNDSKAYLDRWNDYFILEGKERLTHIDCSLYFIHKCCHVAVPPSFEYSCRFVDRLALFLLG